MIARPAMFLIIASAMTLSGQSPKSKSSLLLFLCGDVMTGRGIDQALSHPADPILYESYLKDARQYLQLAERKNGPIDTPLSWRHPWGEAMAIWQQQKPQLKIANPETSITSNATPWPAKGINYRMHPANVPLLKAAGFDFCSLAYNHTLDWQVAGLLETIHALDSAGIMHAGAGADKSAAGAPAIFQFADRRLLIFAYATASSGVPPAWVAGVRQPGVNYLPDLGKDSFQKVLNDINLGQEEDDLVVVSIHWGDNWGYQIDTAQRQFAHRLIDEAGVDLIHGHSSHHPRPLEVYRERLIIYGAGDFINDYEGISGHEEFRPDLSLMYFPSLNASSGALEKLSLYPLQIRQFSLQKVKAEDARWLASVLSRESEAFGCKLLLQNNQLVLQW